MSLCHPFFRFAGLCLGLCLLVLTLSLSACSSGKEEKKRSIPKALVVTAAARLQDVPIELAAFGTMEASESVTIKPMVSGELVTVGFQEGQDVEKDALLFAIDPRPYQAALDKALAGAARNRVVRDNARQDHERYQQLAASGLVSQEQAEGYRTRAAAATADFAADQAMVDNARAQLSYCTIKAPISGRLGALAVDRGNVVKANETALVTINRLTPIRATFTIPEQSLALVRQRLAAGEIAVTAEVPGSDGLTEQGRISFVDNTVDPSTGAIRLKGQFANAEKRLWPGQFVTLSLLLDVRKQAVVIPTQAVQTGQKGPFVFVISSGLTAEVRPVTPGPRHGEIVIIEQGVQAGEEVVIDGHIRVIPGGKVEIKTETKTDQDSKDKAPDSGHSPAAASKTAPRQ